MGTAMSKTHEYYLEMAKRTQTVRLADQNLSASLARMLWWAGTGWACRLGVVFFFFSIGFLFFKFSSFCCGLCCYYALLICGLYVINLYLTIICKLLIYTS